MRQLYISPLDAVTLSYRELELQSPDNSVQGQIQLLITVLVSSPHSALLIVKFQMALCRVSSIQLIISPSSLSASYQHFLILLFFRGTLLIMNIILPLFFLSPLFYCDLTSSDVQHDIILSLSLVIIIIMLTDVELY